MKPEQIKILVADGDEASAAKCVSIIQQGYQVELANNPDDAMTE